MICRNCGADSPRRALNGFADQVDVCETCGGWSYHGKVDAPPSEIYDESYFTGAEYADYAAATTTHRLNFRRKLKLMLRKSKQLSAESRLCEVGCATGEFLGVAREFGIREMLGVEPSAYCRSIGERKGLRMLPPGETTTNQAITDLKPDFVAAWDVWEHLQDPVGIFDDIISRMAPKAVIALTTVDAGSAVAKMRGAKWRQYHPPTHLNFPTRASLNKYLTSRSFSVVHHGSFGYYRPLSEYLRVVGNGSEKLAKKLSVQNFPVYLNLFDIQIVIAQRAAPNGR